MSVECATMNIEANLPVYDVEKKNLSVKHVEDTFDVENSSSVVDPCAERRCALAPDTIFTAFR